MEPLRLAATTQKRLAQLHSHRELLSKPLSCRSMTMPLPKRPKPSPLTCRTLLAARWWMAKPWSTIQDNDPSTKFYVVNDGSPDRRMSTGQRAQPSRTTPSTAATPPRAVRPARRRATRSGSSTPTGRSMSTTPAAACWARGRPAACSPRPQVEGIATNGTDVWIVDDKTDKVYRYTGAASRSSGSQNAASSFSLNSGNQNPKDIVTDGDEPVGRRQLHDRQGVQVHRQRLAGRQLDDHQLRRDQPDGDHDRPDQRRQHLDRRQRHRPRLPVQRRRQPDLGQQGGRRVLRPGSRQHQPARHRRSASAGQPVDDRDVSSLRAGLRRNSLRGTDAALENMYDVPVKKIRIDTVRRSESRKVESPARDLSYSVGASANRSSRTTTVWPMTNTARKWTTCSPSGTPTYSNS